MTYICRRIYQNSISFYYPGIFSILVGLSQSFHCSPPTISIPCIMSHDSPLSHVLLHDINPLLYWPASLCPIFKSNTFFISTSSVLLTYPNHLNLFCFKCSSQLFMPTLNASLLSLINLSVSLRKLS